MTQGIITVNKDINLQIAERMLLKKKFMKSTTINAKESVFDVQEICFLCKSDMIQYLGEALLHFHQELCYLQCTFILHQSYLDICPYYVKPRIYFHMFSNCSDPQCFIILFSFLAVTLILYLAKCKYFNWYISCTPLDSELQEIFLPFISHKF